MATLAQIKIDDLAGYFGVETQYIDELENGEIGIFKFEEMQILIFFEDHDILYLHYHKLDSPVYDYGETYHYQRYRINANKLKDDEFEQFLIRADESTEIFVPSSDGTILKWRF